MTLSASLASVHSAQLPAWWPTALHPDVLGQVPDPTPALVCDLTTVADRYRRLTAALPEVGCHYAVKCNPSPEVVRLLAGLGADFEVASYGELQMLRDLGIDPANVLYSNTVKPAAHIAAAAEAGLWRFAFDSESELHKIARHAPGSAVYVRLRVDDSASHFPLSRKFGADAPVARALLLLARDIGLRPYGVTFHVGSQCGTPTAWRQGIAAAGRLMGRLETDGVRLHMLDLGGGLPASYRDRVPGVGDFATAIRAALGDLLPYRPPLVVAEPGRHLVAESAVMIATVLGREIRGGEDWLHLDVGAYHGLMETQQTVEEWPYPLWSSRWDHATAPRIPFTVTGPTCDSSDTMFYGTLLPATLDVDDRIYIGSAGAYTLSYASHFNGFPPPRQLFVGGA